MQQQSGVAEINEKKQGNDKFLGATSLTCQLEMGKKWASFSGGP